MSNRSRNFDNITDVEAAHRAGVLVGIKMAAERVDDFPERAQTRQVRNAILSLAELEPRRVREEQRKAGAA